MAVAIDAVSTTTELSGVSSFSWTHTPVGTPSAVAVGWAGYSGSGATRTHTVTYGGQACALEVGPSGDPTGSGRTNSIYGKGSPLTGAQTVAISDDTGGPNMYGKPYAVTVTGSNTSDVFSNNAKANGTSSTASVSCTSATGEIVIDACATGSTETFTIGAGQTEIFRVGIPSLGSTRALASYESGAASVTMSWTLDGGTDWDICAASFNLSSPDVTVAASGSASTSASGTQTPSHTIAL